jgi:hypothetical protein
MIKHITTVQETTRCVVNSGRSVGFWTDHWTELGKLREDFPVLYTFVKDGTCRTMLAAGTLSCMLSQTAQGQLLTLQAYLNAKHQTLNGNPDFRALFTTEKTPTTRDYYRLLCDQGVRWLPHDCV